MKTVTLNDHTTFCASGSLVDELKVKMQTGDVVLNFAYTDYGGDFLDKVIIAYFTKNYPDFIVSESAAWNGENAFIFGEPAVRFIAEIENYILGFEDMDSLYSEMQCNEETAGFEYFLESLDKDKYTIGPDALDRLCEERGGYYSVLTSGLDYSERDLIKFCLESDIITLQTQDAE